MSLPRVFAPLALLGALVWSPGSIAADTYNVDVAHSSAIFRIKHLEASWFYGRFNDIAGTFVFDDADPTKTVIDITVKTASVDTNNEKREEHLKSPDFFDAAQYPTMTFKSKKVSAKGNNVFTATGDLSLHGVTKEITFDFERTGTGKDPWGGTRSGAEAVFNIKRTDFGMRPAPDGLSDEVRLIISLEGVKK